MASKSNGVESSAWARAPPVARPFWERALRAVYDPDDNTFLGRTPKRWGIVLIFYLVFYAVLAAFFAICMAGLLSLLEEDKPMYTLESSLIGVNPGVTCRPRPQDDATVRFSTDNSTAYEYYTNELVEFFEPYANESWITSKKECTAGDNFGYPDSPCFFIKLNKIYGWKPQYYDSDFPEDMPADLVQYITMLPQAERQQLWVSCWLEQESGAALQYPWGRGLSGRFYPYLNQRGYAPPPLALRVTPTANTLNIIRCRVWAKNVIYNKSIKEGTGYVRILMQVDSPSYNGTAAVDLNLEGEQAENDTASS